MENNIEINQISLPKLKVSPSVVVTNIPKLSSFNMDALEQVNWLYINGGMSAQQALTSIDLPQLKTCTYFNLSNLPAVTNLDGFNNLTTVSPGYFIISNANIAGAEVKLKTINGFNKLTTVTAGFDLSGASGSGLGGPLTTIQGFQKLTSVHDLAIAGNKIDDISGFKSLTNIAGIFSLGGTALKDLGGLQNLASVGDQLLIYDNLFLTDMKALGSLSTLGRIYFYHNPELASLEGLEKIITLNGEIALNDNYKLANLDGLKNVANANSIRINSNTILKDFCGLNKLITGGSFTGTYTVSSNGYDPTLQDIQDGNCMKR
jgi:hypothetical protein